MRRDIPRIITPPTGRAVSIDEFKRHARIEDSDSDDLAAMYLSAAEAHVSRSLGRAMKPTGFAQDVFSWRRRIELLMPPLAETDGVTAVKIRGADGTLSTADPVTYGIERSAEGRGVITFVGTASARPYYFGGDALASIEFTAGEDPVTESVRYAIIILAATMYDNRSLIAPIGQSRVPVLDGLTSTYWDPVA